jgi:lactam utilization protein B
VAEAAEQARLLANERVVIATSGRRVPIVFETICIHADMEGAIERLQAIRRALGR